MAWEIVFAIVMAVLGHVTHLVKKVVEKRQDGENIGIVQYVKERPYRTSLGLCGSAAAMGWLIETGEVTIMTAFGVGFMADAALDVLRRNVREKV